jgi:alpha-L-rhamnosidase
MLGQALFGCSLAFMSLSRHYQDLQVGPIAYTGMRTVAKIGSVQTTGAKNFRDPESVAPLAGKWQWLADSAKSPSIAGLFRRSFALTRLPARALVRIVSDHRYRLYVNGRLVSRGPADVGRDYDSGAPGPWLYDVRDITGLLVSGTNTLAIEAFSVGLTQNESTSGSPGFLADLQISDEGKGWRQVEGVWRGIPAPHLKISDEIVGNRTDRTSVFQIDERQEPIGWQLPTFDESTWPATENAGEHWANPIPSDIPPSGEGIYPASDIVRATAGVTTQGRQVQVRGNGEFAVRFDRVLSAFVQLRIQGVDGAVVTILPNELNLNGFHRAAQVVLRDGYQVVELPYFDSFSVINLSITGAKRSVVFESVAANFVSYPVTYRGSFECSDPALDRIWLTGRWATQICMQTHHLDSPHHQEPICDPGDYLIESLINYYTFGEAGLARQDLLKFARILRQRNYRNFHLSYALLWLQMLEEYRLYTGDQSLDKELYPTVRELLGTWRSFVGSNGLISESPNYMFMDWVDLAGFNLHHPPAVIGQGYISALYYQALGTERKMAHRRGDSAQQAKCDEDRQQLKAAFNRELWVPERGLYRDGKAHQSSQTPSQWLPADTDIETFSPHVNTLAVACGLTSDDRAEAIMRKVMSWKPLNCQPYFMHFIFEALATSGLFDSVAAGQMKRWQIIPDTQTFYEMWDRGDLSHAWNATPTFQLSHRVLGVSPLTPGFGSFGIAPIRCGLKWARGTVPTPHGEIKVRWEVTAAGVFDLHFTVPLGTSCTVGIPQGFTGKTEEFGPGIHRLRFSPENLKGLS